MSENLAFNHKILIFNCPYFIFKRLGLMFKQQGVAKIHQAAVSSMKVNTISVQVSVAFAPTPSGKILI